MAEKPLTTEAIALTEKKMDMSLDDIIKMSKKNSSKVKRPPRVSNKSQGFQNLVAFQRNSKVQKFIDSRSSIRQGVLAQRRTKFRANQFPLTTEVAKKAAVAPALGRVISYKPRFLDLCQQKIQHFGASDYVVNGDSCFDCQVLQRAHLHKGPSAQRNVVESTSIGKENAAVKPRLQTLDALFANMKQQRMMMNRRMVPIGGSASSQRRRGRQMRQQRGRGSAPISARRRFGDDK